jgi:hypothetical protein
MNLGLITSYVIGGILLIGILAMNMSLSNSSTELTLTQTTREKAKGVQEIISHDIQKIGYNRTGKTSPILEIAESNKISFRSNIDNSTDVSNVERVTWELTTTPLNNGNPNAYVLMRTVEHLETGNIEETPIRLGVTDFKIKYYDEYGEPTDENTHMATPLSSSELPDVRQLYIRLKLESSAKIYNNRNDDGRFVSTVWEKRFSPPNLEPIN